MENQGGWEGVLDWERVERVRTLLVQVWFGVQERDIACKTRVRIGRRRMFKGVPAGR